MSQDASAESISSPEMSHYQVLNVASDATLDEIRRSYQTLALRFHPDKVNRQGSSTVQQSDQLTGLADNFIRIDEAWKVLRDEETRRVYDAELMQRTCRDEYFVNEVLRRADFKYNQEEDLYYYTCRCGGSYVLPEEIVEHENCYIACDECSLLVEVEVE
ncbi:dnaJ homolog subfamily C member 24-like [Armigeres subalbatus]|uniref:dnaJ homolog subfamily C member 24-like n=1 Tax=Armigeres subalbatus TaxID=124917 RepID=UPI002ED072AD